MTTHRLTPGIVLTTDSPISSYGAPAMRFNPHPDMIEDLSTWSDAGPSDVLPSGLTAAEVACRGTRHANAETLAAVRRFCRQWPEGPQPTDERVAVEQEAMWDN